MKHLYFSKYFKVKESDIKKHGAFNISLVTDLPLFIDPFLIFNSEKEEYKKLHDELINYLTFLKDKSSEKKDNGKMKSWYTFSEVQQNWFGYSINGNKGRGLGMKFANAVHENLNTVFQNFGGENITKGTHLEKLCLIRDGVGRDNISDFVTNLTKNFLLEYTQKFTKQYINEDLRGNFRVKKSYFNYDTEVWAEKSFILPKLEDDYVILTPVDILTKDDVWINKKGLIENFEEIPNVIDNDELRHQINNYYKNCIEQYERGGRRMKKKEKNKAIRLTFTKFPELFDYYIKYKEENGEQAKSISQQKVDYSNTLFVENAQSLIDQLQDLGFYKPMKSRDDARERIFILKDFIENMGGDEFFYSKDECISSEKDLQLLFHAICYCSHFDVNREVNNGRGSVDFTFSKGRRDKTLVEFKLAKNKKLEQNLKKQVEIYKKANRTSDSFTVILFFEEKEYKRVIKILKKLGLENDESIVLIDARKKVSASVAS